MDLGDVPETNKVDICNFIFWTAVPALVEPSAQRHCCREAVVWGLLSRVGLDFPVD